MRKSAKALMMTLAAAILLAAATSTATANSLEVSNQGIRAYFPSLIFGQLGGGGNTLTCPVTLEGTFHSRTISKVSGALIGYITRARVQETACIGSANIPNAHAQVLQETLPWHVDYLGFEGTLPSVNLLLGLLNTAFRILELPLGATCLYRGTAKGRFIRAAGGEGRLRADETFGIAKREGSILCPATGAFTGTSETVTLLGTTTSIILRLI
jgi:hypothetical protein